MELEGFRAWGLACRVQGLGFRAQVLDIQPQLYRIKCRRNWKIK